MGSPNDQEWAALKLRWLIGSAVAAVQAEYLRRVKELSLPSRG